MKYYFLTKILVSTKLPGFQAQAILAVQNVQFSEQENCGIERRQSSNN